MIDNTVIGIVCGLVAVHSSLIGDTYINTLALGIIGLGNLVISFREMN